MFSFVVSVSLCLPLAARLALSAAQLHLIASRVFGCYQAQAAWC